MPNEAAIAAGRPARRVVAAIILDAGGVILHPDLDWIAGELLALGVERTQRELLLGYYRTMLEVDLGRGPVTDEGAPLRDLEARRWFFSHLLGHPGAAPAQVAAVGDKLALLAQARFPRESDIYHWTTPGTAERLQRLLDAGFQLAVASNNDGALEAQLRSVGCRHLLGPCLDSGLEGVAKPDPELVLRACRALDLSPTRCLFVGDLDRVDGAAARAAGMPFALLDPLLQERPGRPLTVVDLPALLEHFVPGP